MANCYFGAINRRCESLLGETEMQIFFRCIQWETLPFHGYILLIYTFMWNPVEDLRFPKGPRSSERSEMPTSPSGEPKGGGHLGRFVKLHHPPRTSISYLGGGFKYVFIFTLTYLGKWFRFNLTNIFQLGWNHQLVIFGHIGKMTT